MIDSRSSDHYFQLHGRSNVLEGKGSVRVMLQTTKRGGNPRTIVVERIEPFGGRSEVIRVFFIPVVSVVGGGSDKLLQSEREVDMKR